ncbi:MAG: hypothetical protein LUH36_00910 [Oscillospiraceae bacterium]|nr:hypothetical protein [Oscillospiraceae bacterium]
MSDEISHYRLWKDVRERMDSRQFARELLTEENYLRYLKSCEFTTKGLFIGFLAGYLVPVIVLFMITGDMGVAALFGVSFGVIWMLIWGLFWLIVCRIAPQGKIHREFGKWYKDPDATIGELDVIFYKDDNTTFTAPEFDISSVGSHKLSEKEKKRVRRYGLFLPLVRPFILMAFLNVGVALPLEFINGFVFHDILSDSEPHILVL